MELNTTHTTFPNIRKPSIEVVDLSSFALADAMPRVRQAEAEIAELNKSIEDISFDTRYVQDRALPQ